MKKILTMIAICLAFDATGVWADSPSAHFEICFNPDPTNHAYWPRDLVPEGSSASPYCIDQSYNMRTPGTSAFVNDLFYAVQELVLHVKPKPGLSPLPTLKVSMQFDTTGGNCAATAATSTSTDTIANRHYEVPGALQLLSSGSDSDARNGAYNPYHSDILMNCSIKDLSSNFWLDPAPWNRNTVNASEPDHAELSRADFTSMQMHELLHGLGFESNRTPATGTYASGVIPTKFDTFLKQYPNYYPSGSTAGARSLWQPFLVNDTNQTFFIGPHVLAYLHALPDSKVNTLPGAAIASIKPSEQISTQNFSHIGIIKEVQNNKDLNSFDNDCLNKAYRDGAYKIFGNDLMTMCYEPIFSQNYGIKNNRMHVSTLDYAILEDLGYTIYMPVKD